MYIFVVVSIVSIIMIIMIIVCSILISNLSTKIKNIEIREQNDKEQKEEHERLKIEAEAKATREADERRVKLIGEENQRKKRLLEAKVLIEFLDGDGLMNQYIRIVQALKSAKPNDTIYISDPIVDIHTKERGSASKLYNLKKIGETFGVTLLDYNGYENVIPAPMRTLEFKFLRDTLFFNENISPHRIEDFVSVKQDLKWVVLHLKIGKDSIMHYANVHNIPQEKYTEILLQTYMDILLEFQDPSYAFYICSPVEDNVVINKLKESHMVVTSAKLEGSRELNAIKDLVTVKTFFDNAACAILCMNPSVQGGSTWSTWLYYHMNFKQCIFLDQDSMINSNRHKSKTVFMKNYL